MEYVFEIDVHKHYSIQFRANTDFEAVNELINIIIHNFSNVSGADINFNIVAKDLSIPYIVTYESIQKQIDDKLEIEEKEEQEQIRVVCEMMDSSIKYWYGDDLEEETLTQEEWDDFERQEELKKPLSLEEIVEIHSLIFDEKLNQIRLKMCKSEGMRKLMQNHINEKTLKMNKLIDRFNYHKKFD